MSHHVVSLTGLEAETTYYYRVRSRGTDLAYAVEAVSEIDTFITNPAPPPTPTLTPFAQGAVAEFDLAQAASGWIDWGTDTSYAGGSIPFSGGPGPVVVQVRGQQPETTYQSRLRLANGATSSNVVFTTLAATFVDWTVQGAPFTGAFVAPGDTDRYGVVAMPATRTASVGTQWVQVNFYLRLLNGAGNYVASWCVWAQPADSDMRVTRIAPSPWPMGAWGDLDKTPVELGATPPLTPQASGARTPFLWDGSGAPNAQVRLPDWAIGSGLPLDVVLYLRGVWIEYLGPIA